MRSRTGAKFGRTLHEKLGPDELKSQIAKDKDAMITITFVLSVGW